MSTDRELLELAAKAAGIPGEYAEMLTMGCFIDGSVPCGLKETGIFEKATWIIWNPLTDDGDALRLAANLRICVLWQHDWVQAYSGDYYAREHNLTDRAAVQRRAIVGVAAEIGRNMN